MIERIKMPLWILIAWDVSDAFAKTEDEHHFNLGMEAIQANLPAFVKACLATQAELDRKASTNG